jgi:hypothetical protein
MVAQRSMPHRMRVHLVFRLALSVRSPENRGGDEPYACVLPIASVLDQSQNRRICSEERFCKKALASWPERAQGGGMHDFGLCGRLFAKDSRIEDSRAEDDRA